MNFAFELAWNIDSIAADGFTDYFQKLAAREFGDTYASRIAKIWYGFERLVALRKHEHIERETFSMLKYHEAETIISRWQALTEEAEAIHEEIPSEQKPAFFQLVVHPVKASYTYNLLRVTQTKNRLYAKQRRNTANKYFQECLRLFDADLAITQEYHTILDGKWNHMLRQPHYGYTAQGLGPSRDMIDGLCWVQTKTDSNPSVGQMGIAVEGSEGINPGIINEDSDRTHPSRKWLEPGVTLHSMSPYGPQERYFEVFHRGTVGFDWEARPFYPWIKLSQYKGTLNPEDDDVRVLITIDWQEVPKDFDEKTYIEIIGSVDGYEKIWLPIQNHLVPDEFSGFVEADGYVSIDPGNWASSPYIRLPALGRQDAGSVTLPNNADLSNSDGIPFLRYDVHTFTDRDDVNLELHFNMTLETNPNSHMEYDIRWDNGDIQTYRLTEDITEDYLPNGWKEAVMDCVWKRRHGLGKITAGSHVIELRFRTLNIALEKLVLDLEGIEMKYLGPPESDRVAASQDLGAQAQHVTEGDGLQIELHL